MNQVVTMFLAPKSTLLTGLGTLMSFTSGYYSYNSSPTPEAADLRALTADWKMVGQDLKRAMTAEAKSQQDQLLLGL